MCNDMDYMEIVTVLNLLAVLVTCGGFQHNIWCRLLEVLGFMWFVFDYYDCTLLCTYDNM